MPDNAEFNEVLKLELDIKALKLSLDAGKKIYNDALRDIGTGNITFQKGIIDSVSKQYDMMPRIARAAWKQIEKDSENARRKVEQEARAEVLARQKATDDMLRDIRRAANERAKIEQQVHNQIMRLRAQENNAAVDARVNRMQGRVVQPGLMESLTVGKGLRIAAAGAGAMGSWQGAAAIYGLERMAGAAGKANIAITALSGSTLAWGAALATVAAPLMLAANALELNDNLAKMSTLMDSAAKNANDFSERLNRVAAEASNVSITFNRDLNEVVKSFQEMLSAGIGEGDLEQFSMIGGTLSNALGIDLNQATNVLTSFKDAYQLNIQDLAHVNDILFNTIDVGKVNVSDLINNFGRLIPIASAAGVSIQDVAAGVATLTRQGMTASQSITSMAQLINSLVNPSDKAKKALKELGIAFGAEAFNGRGIVEVIEDIKTKTGGNLDILGEIFREDRALRGVAALEKGVDLLKQTREGIDAVGTAREAADRAMNTFGNNFGKIWKAISNTLGLIGNDILNIFNEIFFGGGPLDPSSLRDVQIIIERIGMALKIVSSVLAGIAKIAFEAAAAVYNLFTLNWSKIGANIESAGFAALAMGNNIGKAVEVSSDRIDKLVDATDKMPDSVKKLKSYSFALTKIGEEADKAAKSTEKLREEQEKHKELLEKNYFKAVNSERERELDKRMSPFQKEQLQALKDEKDRVLYLTMEHEERINRAKQQAHDNYIKEREAQFAEERAGLIQHYNEMWQATKESTIFQAQLSGIDASQEMLETRRKNVLAEGSGFGGGSAAKKLEEAERIDLLIADLTGRRGEVIDAMLKQRHEFIQSKLDEYKNTIQNDANLKATEAEIQATEAAKLLGYDKNAEYNVNKKISFFEDAMLQQAPLEKREEAAKEKKKADEDLAEKQKQILTDVVAEYEKLYKEDVEAYEKAQKDKEKLTKRYNNKILKIEEEHADKIRALQDELFELKMDQIEERGGSPEDKAREAKKAKEKAKSALEEYLASGGSDKNKIELLQAQFQKASAAQYEFGGRTKDRENDLMAAMSFEDQTAANLKAFEQGSFQDQLNGIGPISKKSQAELASEAAANVAGKLEQVNRVINESVSVKVEVDGTLSEATQQALAEKITAIIDVGKKRGDYNNMQPKDSYEDAE